MNPHSRISRTAAPCYGLCRQGRKDSPSAPFGTQIEYRNECPSLRLRARFHRRLRRQSLRDSIENAPQELPPENLPAFPALHGRIFRSTFRVAGGGAPRCEEETFFPSTDAGFQKAVCAPWRDFPLGFSPPVLDQGKRVLTNLRGYRRTGPEKRIRKRESPC